MVHLVVDPQRYLHHDAGRQLRQYLGDPAKLDRSRQLPTEIRRTTNGADDGIRTRDPHLGKVMLYH